MEAEWKDAGSIAHQECLWLLLYVLPQVGNQELVPFPIMPQSIVLILPRISVEAFNEVEVWNLTVEFGENR